MEDDDVDPPASSPPASLQVPEIGAVPNSDAESDSQVHMLIVGNVLSNISNCLQEG